MHDNINHPVWALLSKMAWEERGYFDDFPRGIQPTDVDSLLDNDGIRLLIEWKHYDGDGYLPEMKKGQRLALRQEAGDVEKTVLVVYGCCMCDDPYAVRVLGTKQPGDKLHDWRKGYTRAERRLLLRQTLNHYGGVSPNR